MNRAIALIFLTCGLSISPVAQIGIYQQGSVVKMHMGDCLLAHHGFAVTFAGPAAAAPQEYCPEYTLVSKEVVFVIVGRSSNQLIPLSQTIDFRLHKHELAVRVDDAKREAKFTIKEMMVRSEWERMQRHIEDQLRVSDDRAAMNTRD